MSLSTLFKSIKSKIKLIINKRKLVKFYLSKINNGKSYTAYMLDLIFIRFAIMLLLLVLFYIKTKDFIFSSIICLQFLILFILLSSKLNRAKMSRGIKETNYKIAKKKIFKEIHSKTKYEFLSYIKEILEKCSVENITLSSEQNLDFIGEVLGEKTGIKCFQYSSDNKINTDDIREVFLSLNELKVKEGIIITTSSFMNEVVDFLPKIRDHCRIHLVNMDGLIDIIKIARLYPTDKEIERSILNEITENRRRLLQYRDKVLSKSKTLKYIFISIILYIWGRLTPYTLYYHISSYILLILGLVSLGKYISGLLYSIEDKEDFV